MRGCHNCDVHLYTATQPIVESSHHITFGPFNGAYSQLDKQFQLARLDPNVNAWRDVHDFSEKDESLPIPHWSLVGACVWECRCGRSVTTQNRLVVTPLCETSFATPRFRLVVQH